MTEPLKTINQMAQASAAWIGIGGAIFGVLSFCMILGMWIGPLKELPAQYNVILTKLSAMDKRVDETDWSMKSMASRQDAFAGQVLASSEDRAKIWDRLRSVDTDAQHLKSTALTREDFVEWLAALGARNKGISVPPLTRIRDQ